MWCGGFLSDGQPAILAKHTPEAIKVTQYFANFFIQQAPRAHFRSVFWATLSRSSVF